MRAGVEQRTVQRRQRCAACVNSSSSSVTPRSCRAASHTTSGRTVHLGRAQRLALPRVRPIGRAHIRIAEPQPLQYTMITPRLSASPHACICAAAYRKQGIARRVAAHFQPRHPLVQYSPRPTHPPSRRAAAARFRNPRARDRDGYVHRARARPAWPRPAARAGRDELSSATLHDEPHLNFPLASIPAARRIDVWGAGFSGVASRWVVSSAHEGFRRPFDFARQARRRSPLRRLPGMPRGGVTPSLHLPRYAGSGRPPLLAGCPPGNSNFPRALTLDCGGSCVLKSPVSSIGETAPLETQTRS